MKDFSKDELKRKIYMWLSAAVLTLLLVVGSALLGPVLIQTVKEPEQFREFIESKGAAGIFIFIGIQILQVVFALIPGEVIEVAAGYCFGPLLGTVLCLVGIFLATVPIFYLSRKLGEKFVSFFIDKKDFKRLAFLHDKKKLDILFFILYFIPGTPKDLITYFAGLTEIKPMVFFLIATFGRLPSIVTSTYAGQTLIDQDYMLTLIVFGISGLIALVGYLVYNKISKRRGKSSHQ